MSDSFQGEIPKARINLKLDLHTGGAQKKTELPLKLLVAGNLSHGKKTAPVSERSKINVNKNNFDSVLNEHSPSVNLTVENTLAGDGSEDNISLTFREMNDFTPKQVARQIPRLKAMLAMRNLLRDLKANLLDNQAFRKGAAEPSLIAQVVIGKYSDHMPLNRQQPVLARSDIHLPARWLIWSDVRSCTYTTG